MNGEDIVWSGGEHRFHLGIGQLKALQKKCDAGPMWIFLRMGKGEWFVEDIVETVRLGLIGGGMSDKEARKLVEDEITEPGKYLAHMPLAAQILTISVMKGEDDEGEDEPVGKTEAVTENSYREEKSTSKASMKREPPLVSPQDS